MNIVQPNEKVKIDLRAHARALRAAVNARLDVLADFDLPDDITLAEILDSLRRKRLAAALAVDALRADGRVMLQPNDDDRRTVIEAQVALELAEAECNLFLDRWLDGYVGHNGRMAVWADFFRQRDEWFAMKGTVPVHEWRVLLEYRNEEMDRTELRFDEECSP
jgi:hypothetical protein